VSFRFVLSRSVVRAIAVAAALGLVAAVGVAAADGPPRAELLKIRIGGDLHQTRVVIELDKSATGRLISDKDTPTKKVALALMRVDTAGDMAGAGEGLVTRWTVDGVGGSARVNLELRKDAVVLRRFLLPPAAGLNAYRYVLDLGEYPPGAGPPAQAPTGQTGQSFSVTPTAPLVTTARLQAPRAKKVIVIDAGHGGRDSGALGSTTQEKTDTLMAAKDLKTRLERTGRYTVVMTRDTDAYIPLETRVLIARRANADLFISLHADSIGTVGAATRGASVYTLSERGADRTARGVFGRSDWFMNVNLPGQDSATKRILLDLTQRQNVNRSSTFAELLLERLNGVTPLLRRSHRDANLMVLLAPDVPAVLLEMGFITNAEDEEALADPDHRKKVMGAVTDAIEGYFEEEERYAAR
jgi:N-acetylmuramoyl-L-alanine amidase